MVWDILNGIQRAWNSIGYIRRTIIFSSEYLKALDNNTPPLHYIKGFSENPKAPLLIFLHGFPESSYAWSAFLPYYVNKGFNVLAPDLRGYLLSSGYQGKQAWQIRTLVEDIRRLIKTYQAQDVCIIGHDLGGAVAWQLAETCPALCQSLILLNSPHPGTHAKMFRTNPWLTFKQTCRLWYIYVFQIPYLPEKIMLKGKGFWLDYIFKRWIKTDVPSLTKRIQYYKKILNDPKSLKEAIATYRYNVFGRYGLRLLKPYLFKNDYHPIPQKVLILWGEKDFLFENKLYEYTHYYCQQKIHSHVWPTGGHWLHHEHTEEVIKQIDNFLSKQIPSVEKTTTPDLSTQLTKLFDKLLERKITC